MQRFKHRRLGGAQPWKPTNTDHFLSRLHRFVGRSKAHHYFQDTEHERAYDYPNFIDGLILAPACGKSACEGCTEKKHSSETSRLAHSRPSKFVLKAFPARPAKQKQDKGKKPSKYAESPHCEFERRSAWDKFFHRHHTAGPNSYLSGSTLGPTELSTIGTSRHISELSSESEHRSHLVELETLYELPSPSDDALLKECEDRIQERRQHELSRHTWELDAMERNQPLPTAQRNILSGLERKSEQCARSQGDRTVRAASDGILARNFPKDENSSRATQGTSEEAVPKRTLRQFHTLRWPRSRSMHARQDKETLAQRSSSTVTSSSTICPDESASQIIPLANVGSAPAFLANTNPETHGRNVALDNPSTHFHCLTCPWPTCDIRLQDLGITVLSHLNGHIERIRETRKPDDYSCPWPECPEPFIFKDDHVSAYHILPLACRSTQTSRPGRVSSHNDLQDQSPAYIRLWERAHLLDRDIDQLQRRIFERRRRCHMSAKCNHSKLKPWAERDNAVQICKWEDELAHVRVALTRQTRAPAAPVNMNGKHRAKLNSDHASCTKLAEMVADLELQQEKRGVADRDENCSIALRALTSDRTGPGNEKAHARQGEDGHVDHQDIASNEHQDDLQRIVLEEPEVTHLKHEQCHELHASTKRPNLTRELLHKTSRLLSEERDRLAEEWRKLVDDSLRLKEGQNKLRVDQEKIRKHLPSDNEDSVLRAGFDAQHNQSCHISGCELHERLELLQLKSESEEGEVRGQARLSLQNASNPLAKALTSFSESMIKSLLEASEHKTYQSGASNGDTSSSGSASASTAASGSSSTSPPNGARRSGEQKRSGDDDLDGHGRDGSRPPKRTRQTVSPTTEPSQRRLACPFHQRNPPLYQTSSCTGPGFQSVAKLKSTHLERQHRRGPQCPRCWKEFQTADALMLHHQADRSCQRRDEPVHDRISDKKWKELIDSRKYAQARTEEEKWRVLYKTLFPTDDFVPSSYYAHSSYESIEGYRSYLRVQMPTLLSEELQKEFAHLLGPLYAQLQAKYIEIEQRCFTQAHEMYVSKYGARADSTYGTLSPSSSSRASGIIYELEPAASFAVGWSTSSSLETSPESQSNFWSGSPVSPPDNEIPAYVNLSELHMPIPQYGVGNGLHQSTQKSDQVTFGPVASAATLQPPMIVMHHAQGGSDQHGPMPRPQSRATIGLPPIMPPMRSMINAWPTKQLPVEDFSVQFDPPDTHIQHPPMKGTTLRTTSFTRQANEYMLSQECARAMSMNNNVALVGKVNTQDDLPPDSGVVLSPAERANEAAAREIQLWDTSFSQPDDYNFGSLDDLGFPI